VRVTQGEDAKMFDTKTTFMFTDGKASDGSESGESGESGMRKASKTNGSNATVASSNKSDTVSKIVKTATKPAQQQNTTDGVKTRSQTSQAAAASKVNEADKNNTSPKSLRKSKRIEQMKISSK
jgi:hypothetical protein